MSIGHLALYALDARRFGICLEFSVQASRLLPLFFCAVVLCAQPAGSAQRGSDTGRGLNIDDGFRSADLAEVMVYCPLPIVPDNPFEPRCKFGAEYAVNPAKVMKFYPAPSYSILTLKNTGSRDRSLVLEHHLAITGRVSVADFNRLSDALSEAGDAVAVGKREIRSALPAFRIYLARGETKTFRISIASEIVTRPGFNLYAESIFFEASQKSDLMQALFYGLMGCMIIYNFLLYLRLRVRTYLLYVLFLSAFSLIHLAIYGYGYLFLWPDQIVFQKYVRDAAKFAASFLSVAFFSDLLSVASRMPRFYAVVRWAYPAIAGSAVMAIFLTPMGFFTVSNIVTLLAVCHILVLAVLSLMGKLPFSMYYIGALISMLSGAIINLMMVLGGAAFQRADDLFDAGGYSTGGNFPVSGVGGSL